MHLAQAVTPRNHSGGDVKLIDILTYFDENTKSIGKLNRFLISGVTIEDVTRYLPGMDRLKY